MAEVLHINPDNPQGRLIRRAAEALERGGIIIYPTDTVYGIGCDLFNKKAIERIYQLKVKMRKQPLSFIVPDLKEVSSYAIVSNYAYRIMRKLLPGPYTFVLPATKMVPKKIAEVNKKTVGIRIPDNNVCHLLLEEFPRPIISTSANLSGSEVLNDPEVIQDELGEMVDVILNCGLLGLDASTVINLTGDEAKILREGKGPFPI